MKPVQSLVTFINDQLPEIYSGTRWRDTQTEALNIAFNAIGVAFMGMAYKGIVHLGCMGTAAITGKEITLVLNNYSPLTKVASFVINVSLKTSMVFLAIAAVYFTVKKVQNSPLYHQATEKLQGLCGKKRVHFETKRRPLY